MVIENMTVRDAIQATQNVGRRFEPIYADVGVGDKSRESVNAGKEPFFTGLKSFIVTDQMGAVSLPYWGWDDDHVISGPVKLVGQWVWYNPDGLIGYNRHLYVNVPTGEGEFLAGGTFDIGTEYIDADDDMESVRAKIIERRDRIYAIATEHGIIEKAVA